MTGLGHDVGHALRLLVKNPGFTAVVVLTLALAIGVNTSVFSIVNAVLFKPLPVEDPEGLVHIYTAVPDGFLSHEPMAHPDFEDVRNEVKSLSHVVGYAFTRFVLETSEDNELILGNWRRAITSRCWACARRRVGSSRSRTIGEEQRARWRCCPMRLGKSVLEATRRSSAARYG